MLEQHARGDVGRRLQRDPRLALAAAREPLLARPARAVAAVDLAAADLRGHEPAAGEHAGRVAAEPDQHDADDAVARHVVEQRRRVEALAVARRVCSGGNGGSQSTAPPRADERRRARRAQLGPLDRPVLVGPPLEPAAEPLGGTRGAAKRSLHLARDSMRRP